MNARHAVLCALFLFRAPAIARAACADRVKHSAADLTSCVRLEALWQHLETFQAIADANPDRKGHGNRNTGTRGYEASVDYVARTMRNAGYRVTIEPYDLQGITDYNVIADSPYGDPNRVVVVDAHLDSIFGAGILDNATGSATILEIARQLAITPTANHLRFIWFGGEELGLWGSHHYTQALTKAERDRIVFDIDADVTATPNYSILVADPRYAHNADRFPPDVIPRSRIGNAAFAAYFRENGIPSRAAPFGNSGTDSNSFSLIGVPNSGILTGQDCCRQHWEVKLWGGYPGDYEGQVPGYSGGCVDRPHLWCDDITNTNPEIFVPVSRAVAYVTYTLANDPSLRR